MSDSIRASLQELHQLADLIKSSVDNIEKACLASGQPFPYPREPFSPESEAVRMSPEVQQAGSVLFSAAAQLVSTVQSPIHTVITYNLQFHISSCLRAAINFHVAEILRSAGLQGLHIQDIAAPTGVDAGKLARILRVLATHHVFLEVAPDTFANNRISSALDTGKSVSEILANPDAKYDNTNGIAAIMDHTLDEAFKSSAYLTETLKDPTIGHSGSPSEAAFSKAFNTDLVHFEWIEKPENSFNLRRFGIAMRGVNNLMQTHVATGFDWAGLPQDSLVVDVGGGIGSQTLTLAKAYDHLKFIVQDREAVVTGSGAEFWAENFPEAISSGRVKLQAHDFFGPQNISKPAVFLLRLILHDWSEEYCLTILRHLRAAAGPDTQLVVVDNVMSYACPGSLVDIYKNIPGAKAVSSPPPLLSNFGAASGVAYLTDMQMMTFMNAMERTLPQFDELFSKSGWKLARVSMPAGGMVTQGVKIIGVPADEITA